MLPLQVILILIINSLQHFYTVNAVDANTTSISEPLVTVLEGNSVTISCVSTGAPTPSITWKFNDEVATFIPSNMVDGRFSHRLVRDSNGNIVPDITPGSITSNLTIVNAQYPDHDGVYTCIGSNDEQSVNNSTASITVQVQGKLLHYIKGVRSLCSLTPFI